MTKCDKCGCIITKENSNGAVFIKKKDTILIEYVVCDTCLNKIEMYITDSLFKRMLPEFTSDCSSQPSLTEEQKKYIQTEFSIMGAMAAIDELNKIEEG